MTRSDEAKALFAQGFSCSQAIMAAFAPSLGLDRETAMKIASGFGGGSACQAVSDAGEDGIAIYKTLGGASAHGGQTYINMVSGAGPLVVAHEAGHTLEQVARSSDPKILEKWAEVAVADKISVSGYGGDEGGHEDIAEFAMAYAVCLDAGDGKLEFLKELSPRRFAMWEKVLYWPPQTVAKDKEKKGGEEKENAQRNEGKGSN
jgi:hypothetical protein